MTIKRNPTIKSDHLHKYERISKADLVEAFRDFARDVGGFGEFDETLWFAELERRVEVVREQRKAGNSMLHSETIEPDPAKPKTLFADVSLDHKSKCRSFLGLGNSECPVCGSCRSEKLIGTGDTPRKPIGEVVRRTSWLVWFCNKCETVSIDPRKIVYIGDGDYDQMKDPQGRSELVLSFAEWDQGAYHVEGRLITVLFDIQPKRTVANHEQ